MRGTDDRRQSSIPAQRLGLAVDDYVARRAAGEKWCWRCASWQPLGAWGRNRTTADGLGSMCRDCKRDYDRERHRQRTGAEPRAERQPRPRTVAPRALPPAPAPAPAPPATDDLARARARIAARRARAAG